jgi:hypothetical protein
MFAAQNNELKYACDARLHNYIAFADVQRHRETILTFARLRPAEMYKQMRELNDDYELNETYKITVEGADGMKTRLNTIPIDSRITKSADYFTNFSVPLTTAETVDYVSFSHWEVNGRVYRERNLTLNAGMAVNGAINVKLVTIRHEVSPVIIYSLFPNGGEGWITLHNTSDEAVSTLGLFLSDNVLNRRKFRLPDITIEAGGYVRIAFERNPAPESFAAALNFNASRGEIITLTDGNGFTLSQFVRPRLMDGYEYRYCLEYGLYHVRMHGR